MRLMFIGLVVGVFCFIEVMPQYSQGYMAAFIDKMDRAATIKGSKVLLIGDSNVLFGIRSDMLEDALGMPVVNMGMHGGMGQTMCMDIIQDVIQEGDIVVALPAHYYYPAHVTDANLAWLMLENHVELWRGVDPRDYLSLVKAFPTYIRKALDLWINDLGNDNNTDLSRRDRNKYGDIISSGDENSMPDGWRTGDGFMASIDVDLIEYYNKYNLFVSEKDGYFMMAAPPIIEPSVEGNEQIVDKRQEKIEDIANFLFISNSREYIFPIEYFGGTNYHLNNTGRIIRTQQLIKDIKKWMKEGRDNNVII